ncbi:hypothetical protein [Flaviflexus massiliensis]|uniref:hypothetical protein n=1 Tax=Flaviflexus massiliensis TaxID=1522309 RepID=UPI0006D5A648|nr:hypothetical protein [Flaviflexus massiliensis]
MFFRRSHNSPLSPADGNSSLPTPPRHPQEGAPDPVIDAQIHWLAQRGLKKATTVTQEEWIGATEDPTDPFSLATAHTSEPCVTPDPAVTITAENLVDAVEELADGLELPIDDVSREGGALLIRSGASHYSFVLTSPETGEARQHHVILEDVARTFVDSAHVLHRVDSTYAIVHRDIAEIALDVMKAETALGNIGSDPEESASRE